MLDGMFVFNAVSHAYNLTDENTLTSRHAQSLRDLLLILHRDWQPGIGLSALEQTSDWPIEILARTLFLESDCDMAATHTLRLDSYFKDGLCARKKSRRGRPPLAAAVRGLCGCRSDRGAGNLPA